LNHPNAKYRTFTLSSARRKQLNAFWLKFICLKATWIVFFAFGFFISLSAQTDVVPNLKNLRNKTITLSNDTIVMDSLSILSSSFKMTSPASTEAFDSAQYVLDWVNGKLIILDTLLLQTKVKIQYRVFPFKLESVAFHKSKDKIVPYNSDSVYFNPYYYRPSENENASTVEWGQLNYSGSFARGVSFGSSQSLALNSELDLQLTGLIGKDVEITAALSDNNIPIQPDGNTAQVQDFDRVFIKIKKDKHEVIAGDYELEEKNGYFMKYYKQLQGASYEGEFDILNKLKLQSSISFSIAKGQFSRNIFDGKEGNQGPYRLTGNNGETFIIILAGSENVYIDNILQKRGQEYDYVMDYNSGEIVFTPNRLITKDSRIVVEFEYADRNYFRSFIQTRHALEYKKFQTWFKFYNEQDNKNNPINVTLDPEDVTLLSSIGDNLNDAFVSGVNEVEFTADRVLYKLMDTIVNAVIYDSIFVYSTNVDSAIYALSFSFVGLGNGYYDPGINAANGRVFEWKAPDINGNLTGSYEPKLLLITPKRKRLLTLGAKSQLNDHWTIEAEGAMSNNDVNTFSELDSDDDTDFAAQGKLSYKNRMGKKENWTMNTNLGYEYKGNSFKEIEPYRPVEFNRDWNIGFNDSIVNEHFVYGDIGFIHKTMNLNYRFTNFNRKGVYLGYKNNLTLEVEKRGWKFNTITSVLNTKDLINQSLFFRPYFKLQKDFAFWKGTTFGITGMQEYNKITNLITDSLFVGSFLNNTLGVFIQSSDTAKVIWKLNYDRRVDKDDQNNSFVPVTFGNTFQFHGDVRSLKSQNLKWQLTYRNLVIKDTLLTTLEPDNNVLGRIEYGFAIKKGAIRFNTVYELGSGQERQRDFTYLRVQNGEGIYSWIDQNSDAVQQQNEFVVSQFADSANFIRVFTNFNEFVQTNVTNLDQSLYLNPKIVWPSEKGIKGFIARLTLQSSLTINKRSLKDEGGKAFNPFQLTSGNDNIVAVNANIRNSLYFNRSSAIYKITYIQNWAQNKVLLLNGIDERLNASHAIESRWNIKKFIAIILEGTVGDKSFNSKFFDSDDFDIRKYSVKSGVEYTWKTKLRTGVTYNYGNRTNQPQFGGERAKIHEMRWDFKFSLVGKSTLTAETRFVQIGYNGEVGSTKSYEILEGLNTGQNYLWGLRLDQNLARNIQLTLQYEGRKTGDNNMINTGRAQIRALF
jgi:hypothetical protein